tara:strand:+ start:434 stop:4174 length:3741 start_codon:yes stop_codon:yes gene_type:complete
MSSTSRKMQQASSGTGVVEDNKVDSVLDLYRHSIYMSDDDIHTTSKPAVSIPSLDFTGISSTNVNEAFAINHINPISKLNTDNTSSGVGHTTFKKYNFNYIKNGIDLYNNGGIVVMRHRSYNGSPIELYPGQGKYLYPSNNNSEAYSDDKIVSSSGTGFTEEGFVYGNGKHNDYLQKNSIAWTFRNMPKFMQKVYYTGDGSSNRQISHNLDCDVGMMWIKALNQNNGAPAGDWIVWHKSQTGNKGTTLNSNDIFQGTAGGKNIQDLLGDRSNVVPPTSTQFTVGTDSSGEGHTNWNNVSYMAILFAHDTSDTSMIKCGSFITGSSPTGPPATTLGWQPQFILYKCASLNSTSQGGSQTQLRSAWMSADTASWPRLSTGSTSEYCSTNFWSQTDYEYHSTGGQWSINNPVNRNLKFTPTGFDTVNQAAGSWDGSQEFVYMAIRDPEYSYPNAKGYGGFMLNMRGSQDYVNHSGTTPILHSTAVRDTNHRWRMMMSNTPSHEDGLNNTLGVTNYNKGVVTVNNSTYDQLIHSTPGNRRMGHSFQFRDNHKFMRQINFEGNGAASNIIRHDLGCQVGAIWIKRYDNTGTAWQNRIQMWHLAHDGDATDESNNGPCYWFIPRIVGIGMSVSDMIAFDADAGSDYYINGKRCVGIGASMGITDNTIDIGKLKPDINVGGNSPTAWDYAGAYDSTTNANGGKYMMIVWANDKSVGGRIRCGSTSNGFNGQSSGVTGFHPGLLMLRGGYDAGSRGWTFISERTRGGVIPMDSLASGNSIDKNQMEDTLLNFGAITAGNNYETLTGAGGYSVQNTDAGVGFATGSTYFGSLVINDGNASEKIMDTSKTHMYIAIADGDNSEVRSNVSGTRAGQHIKNGYEAYQSLGHSDCKAPRDEIKFPTGSQYISAASNTGGPTRWWATRWTNGVDMCWSKTTNNSPADLYVHLKCLGDSQASGLTTLSLNGNNTGGGTSGLTHYQNTTNGFFHNNGGMGRLGDDYYGANSEHKFFFRKAPKIFDIANCVAQTNTQDVYHALGCVPAMVWMKDVNNTINKPWYVRLRPDLRSTEDPSTSHSYLGGFLGATSGSSNPNNAFMTNPYAGTSDIQFYDNKITIASGASWTDMGKANNVEQIYLLWGDGTEAKTGAGSSHYQFKCGTFVAGSGASSSGYDLDFGEPVRFLMLKRMDAAGDWYMWDYMWGMTSTISNDPMITLNSGAAPVTNQDFIQTSNAGIKIQSTFFNSPTYGGLGRYLYMGYT